MTDGGQDAHLIDCAIVGAGVAGLSAALFLGRAGRSTVVFDDGSPRILVVDRVREFLGHDGEPPPDLLAQEHREVLRYGVDVVSAEESIYSGNAEFVVLPGVLGELGIYPKHIPLITQIRPGQVRIKVPGEQEETIIFVQGGFLEVQPDVVTVLADTAIRAHDLDEAKAIAAKQAAEDALQNKTSKEEIARAEGELAGAMAQLAAIRKLRRGRR